MKKSLLALLLLNLGQPAYAQGFACYLSAPTTTCFLPVNVKSGGTGLTSGTSGGVPYFNASSTMASSGALTTNGVMLGGGAGGAPTSTGADATTTHVLHGGSPPTFGAVAAGDLPTVTQSAAGAVASAGQLLGTNTNDAATAGHVGEIISCSFSSTALSTTTINLCSMALTAGDWMTVCGIYEFGAAGNSNVEVALSANSASFSGTVRGITDFIFALISAAGTGAGQFTAFVQNTGTTNWFFIGANSTSSTNVFGGCTARRFR